MLKLLRLKMSNCNCSPECDKCACKCHSKIEIKLVVKDGDIYTMPKGIYVR